MKKCPFCRADITIGNDICPHCHRVLVERIYSGSKPKASFAYGKIKDSPLYSIKKKLRHLTKSWKFNDFKKYIPILALFVLVIFLATNKGDEATEQSPVSVIPKNEEAIKNEPVVPVQTPEPKIYTPLPNGTHLSKNGAFLRGMGQLKIDNGTSFDAVAKLVNTKTKKSVLTLYIQANNVYTIKNISNGSYRLFFNLGNDWDKDIQAFATNSSYELFEESFDFTTPKHTEGDYVVTQYKTFNVTLNPIVGGNAPTEHIGREEFGIY